jgi:hypothetical protein
MKNKNKSLLVKPIQLVDSDSNIELAEIAFAGMVNKIPLIGGFISEWYSQERQKIVLERIQNCLNSVIAKLQKIDYNINNLESDNEFAELTVNTLAKVTETLNSQKREYYANLIANTAVKKESEEREEMRSMSALLDQLEVLHIKTLDKIMNLPYSQSVLFFGAVREISNFDIREFSKKEHYALGTLEELGLVDFSQIQIDKNEFIGPLKISSRGISFHEWITEPQQKT